MCYESVLGGGNNSSTTTKVEESDGFRKWRGWLGGGGAALEVR